MSTDDGSQHVAALDIPKIALGRFGAAANEVELQWYRRTVNPPGSKVIRKVHDFTVGRPAQDSSRGPWEGISYGVSESCRSSAVQVALLRIPSLPRWVNLPECCSQATLRPARFDKSATFETL